MSGRPASKSKGSPWQLALDKNARRLNSPRRAPLPLIAATSRRFLCAAGFNGLPFDLEFRGGSYLGRIAPQGGPPGRLINGFFARATLIFAVGFPGACQQNFRAPPKKWIKRGGAKLQGSSFVKRRSSAPPRSNLPSSPPRRSRLIGKVKIRPPIKRIDPERGGALEKGCPRSFRGI